MGKRQQHGLSACLLHRVDVVANFWQVLPDLLERRPPGDADPWSVGAVRCHGTQHPNIWWHPRQPGPLRRLQAPGCYKLLQTVFLPLGRLTFVASTFSDEASIRCATCPYARFARVSGSASSRQYSGLLKNAGNSPKRCCSFSNLSARTVTCPSFLPGRGDFPYKCKWVFETASTSSASGSSAIKFTIAQYPIAVVNPSGRPSTPRR